MFALLVTETFRFAARRGRSGCLGLRKTSLIFLRKWKHLRSLNRRRRLVKDAEDVEMLVPRNGIDLRDSCFERLFLK